MINLLFKCEAMEENIHRVIRRDFTSCRELEVPSGRNCLSGYSIFCL